MSVKQWKEDEEIYLEYYVSENQPEEDKESCFTSAAEYLDLPKSKVSSKVRKMRIKNKEIGHLRRPFTKQEIEYIKKMYSTTSPKRIAEKLNRSTGTVINKANNLGIKRRDKISDYDEQIRKLALEGYYKTEIARMLGLQKNSVIDYINRNGISCVPAPKEVSQKYWREEEWKRHHISKHYRK